MPQNHLFCGCDSRCFVGGKSSQIPLFACVSSLPLITSFVGEILLYFRMRKVTGKIEQFCGRSFPRVGEGSRYLCGCFDVV